MVAFKIVVSGGLIPHARHGGSDVEAVAAAGSKLEGTGLENEHMGQTQVAFTLCEAEACLLCDDCPVMEDDVLLLLSCPKFRLGFFENIAILGEDFR